MEVNFAKAQVAMGATLIGVGDAAASLVGPRLYHQFVQPFEKRLVSEIHALGVLVRLHICGNTRRIVKGMGETGADIIDLDFLTPLAEARAAMTPHQMLLGNIDPVRALRDGTPESVEAALDECYAQARARLHRRRRLRDSAGHADGKRRRDDALCAQPAVKLELTPKRARPSPISCSTPASNSRAAARRPAAGARVACSPATCR